MRPAVAILAAGASRRLGSPKALVNIDGVTLVQRALALANALEPAALWLCVGADRESICASLPRGISTLDVPDWAEGQSAALRAAARAAQASGHSALLVLLLDQWRLQIGHLRALCAVASAEHAAASRYAGLIGAPALFPARWYPRLLGLHGDAGARALLREATDVRAVDCADPGDWDTV
jgi:CTP:molybdopterin cytidylyltransferase MocA